jgi:class 3 adenylate cyclase/tetratricopeptide (TPR) repeat protein
VIACPACGTQNPEGFVFCGRCATPLAGKSPSVREERKVVTALFCDLVDFTTTSESADPEDVDAMLAAYFSMAQARIETHGGIVEKFIGDAVVGIFGVPAAHEDDPERAVRAALRIVEDAEGMTSVNEAPLRLRIGVNTGETLVRLGVVPGSGDGFITGDAINTASRIQTVAPDMGVAVGSSTFEVTKSVFDYAELPTATLKGKSVPVAVFHAKSPLARFGADVTRTHDTPFIGREVDLALLKGLFDKVVASSAPQLVTVVGEPGLGKSRLVAEFFRHIDRLPQLITWRQGRCPPYGEGITFWALGEILKAHAGILESDSPEVASTKLDAVLPEDGERAWFRQRLLPLLGIEATSTAEREELFTAWRRFLEHIAEADPTVLVFEDLHWADPAMLDFIEHLADRAGGVPLLIVGTARPELFEKHPDYARGLRNSTPINLGPLSEQETARLVSALLDSAVIPADLQAPLLERAGGNPLYAEEYVRLLKDKNLLIRNGTSWQLVEGADIPFPDSVQALIAARIDTLSPQRKAMLADAAVVGKAFWVGAVAAMGEVPEDDVAEAMRELTRKELVRPVRHSSMEGQAEFAFWHVLARDVAYGQLPRQARASRHIAAAAWIESQAGGRVEDLADVLAYHYATAVDLTQAAGELDQVGALQVSALRFLTLAGERALGLDTTAALSNFQRALDLTAPSDSARPSALAKYGEAALHAGRLAEAQRTLEEAEDVYRARADVLAQVSCMVLLSRVMHRLGDSRWAELPVRALELLEPLPPGPAIIEAYSELARVDMLQARNESAIRYANLALGMAVELGHEQPARALGYRGLARASLGDAEGLDDLKEAIGWATEGGQGREVALLHNNLALAVWQFYGSRASLEVAEAGIAFARARGLAEITEVLVHMTVDLLNEVGRADEALLVASELAPRLEASGSLLDLIGVRPIQVSMLVTQGRAADAAQFLDWIESTSRTTGDPEDVVVGLGSVALARAALGQVATARALLREVVEVPPPGDGANFVTWLPTLVRTALVVDEPHLAVQLTDAVAARYPSAERALVAAEAALDEARQDLPKAAAGYAQASAGWAEFGFVPEAGFALLGQGRCLVALSRADEAVPILQQARDIFERIGARPALAETDALLAIALDAGEAQTAT